MIEIPRVIFKNDPAFKKLYDIIKLNHKVASHTQQTHATMGNIPDLCESSRHFNIVEGGPEPMYIHYDVATWFKEPNGYMIKIEKIGVYETFMEYETERLKQLNSVPMDQSSGGNFN